MTEPSDDTTRPPRPPLPPVPPVPGATPTDAAAADAAAPAPGAPAATPPQAPQSPTQGQPFPPQPTQQYPAQPPAGQPFPPQPTQQYPSQPTQAQHYPQQYPSQPAQGQQSSGQPFSQQPTQQYPAQPSQGQPGQGQPTQQNPSQSAPGQQPTQQYPSQPGQSQQVSGQPFSQQPTQQYPSQPAPGQQSSAQPFSEQPTQQYPLPSAAGQPSSQQPTQQYPSPPASGQPTSQQPTQQYPSPPASAQPTPGRPAATTPSPAPRGNAANAPAGRTPSGPVPPFGATPPASAPDAPRKKRRRGPLIAIISTVVVLILLIAGGIVGYTVGTEAHAPEKQVEAYLDALVKGDASEALKLAGTKVDADTDVLLTDDAYADVADRPSAYDIGRITTSGETATVTATLTQGDAEITEEFTLRKDGKDAVFFDKWALEEVPLGTVAVTITGPSAVAPAVDGIAIPEGATSLRALPGTYEVALADDNEFFQVEAQQVTVEGFSGSAAAATADLTVSLTDAGTQKANDAVNAWLDACQASTEFDPAGCSFYATGKNPSYTYTNTKWTLAPRPTFKLGEWNGTGYRVSTDASGIANLTADIRDNASGATGTATAGPIPVFVNGDITDITADGATFVSAIAPRS